MSLSPCLHGLPPELLDLIVCYFESTSTLSRFALTCRAFSQYVKQDGFRVFVQTNFPFSKTSSNWSDAARSFTSLYRAWRRKSYIARDLKPDRSRPNGLIQLTTQHGGSTSGTQGPTSRQSMGYQPVISSLSRGDGHIVAWGAGAELVLRATSVPSAVHDDQGKLQWVCWKDSSTVDGKDDITSLNLLPSQGVLQDYECDAFIGRASGKLERVTTSQESVKVYSLDTRGRAVRSAHVSPASEALLAAALDDDVALYDAHSSLESQYTLAERSVFEEGRGVATWTVKFLGHNRLGVGRGPSYSALRVFDIAPDGSIIASMQNCISVDKDSLYCIEPLLVTKGHNSLFLAGWYSGSVTLHDLRSPENVVLKYEDPIDPSSAIYSLCSFANDRFVAGGGRHSCMKVFDLRLSGAHTYACGIIDKQISQQKYEASSESFEQDNTGYNIFLSPAARTHAESPIYSLSTTSAYSPTFYAGLENRVMQLDLYSICDELARPQAQLPYANRLREPRVGPDVGHQAVNLALIEHTYVGAHSLWRQEWQNAQKSSAPGWDPCWIRGGQNDAQLRLQNVGSNRSTRSHVSRRRFRY